MKTNFRIIGLAVLALSASVAVFAPGGTRQASAAGSEIDCHIPNNVVCEISNPAGIKHVTVTLHTGLGDVDVVDKGYFNCPTSVTVSWDPIVPSSSMDVEPCSGVGKLGITLGHAGGPDGRLGLATLIQPQPAMAALNLDCGPYSGAPFTPCDASFKALCSALGGDYTPGRGSSECDVPDFPPPPSRP